MPKCKNDPTRWFKGNEPSPTGLGYSSRVEEINSTKQGKDGNMWIVSINKNNIKRWILFQTYPYISVIIWIKNNLKNNNAIVNLKDITKIDEINNLVDELYDNNVDFEIGWSNLEIDFEIFNNLNLVSNKFYTNFKNLKTIRSESLNIDLEVSSTEVLLIDLDNNEERKNLISF